MNLLTVVGPLVVVVAGIWFFGLVGAISSVALFIIFDFVRFWDTSIPLQQQIPRYTRFRRNCFLGWWTAGTFEEQTTNIKQTQETVLRRILEKNASSSYAKDHKLQDVRTKEEFVKIHSLTKYSDFKDYCLRQTKGEKNVLSVDDVLFFGLTSGTTGEPSKIPMTSSSTKHYADVILPLMMRHLTTLAPRIDKMNRRLYLANNPRKLLQRTEDGTPMGPASGFLLGMDPCTTPEAGFGIKDEPSCRYVHLLFGLRKRDLESIEAIFVSVVYLAFRDLEKQWPKLVKDIRDGTLDKDLIMENDERRALEVELSADPIRAAELDEQFTKGFQGIVTRIWPKLTLIICVTSGSFGHYTDMVREKYLGDNGKTVRMFGPVYGSTEGLLGINFWPDILPSRYLITASNIFYEFIPYDRVGEDQPPTLFVEQIEKGQDYEIVLTTDPGFRRYRLGDVVRVVDFYNRCPVIELLHRTTQLLSIKGEKTSEISLLTALSATLSSMSLKMEDTIVDYASCESLFLERINQDDTSVKSPYYAVFLELAEKCEADVFESPAFSEKLDRSLCESQGRYRYQREKGGLDQLHVIFLQTGAFEKIRYFMLDTSTASPAQLKIPKILRKPELVEYVVSLHKNSLK